MIQQYYWIRKNSIMIKVIISNLSYSAKVNTFFLTK
jgi:hypothetical protein